MGHKEHIWYEHRLRKEKEKKDTESIRIQENAFIFRWLELEGNYPSSVGSVAKRLNNERQIDHHVASSILGSDTLLCLQCGAWGGISVAK